MSSASSTWRASNDGWSWRDLAADCAGHRPAAVAAGGGDLPLPAALRVLLQPARFREDRARRRAVHRRLAARAARGAGARRRAVRLLRRRAADARRSGGTDRRGAPAGLLHQPAHLRRRADEGAGAGAEGRRPRPCAAQLPGLDPRAERLPQPHQDLPAQAGGRRDHQGTRLADGDERGDPPPQHRPHRPHHRDGGRARRRVSGTGELAVLLLGAPEPRPPAADQRADPPRRSRDR